LLFDFDGVLADSADRTIAVCYEVARKFGATVPMTRELLSNLDDMSITGGGRAMGVPEAQLALFETALSERFREVSADYRPFDGIVKVLQVLGAKHSIGIITNNSERVVEEFLERNRLGRIMTLGAENGEAKHLRIREAARRVQIGLERTFMVGDSKSDIIEARLAGCRAVAATWGFQSRDFLASSYPDYLISSPYELITVFSAKAPEVVTS